MRNKDSQPNFTEFYESVKTDILSYIENRLNWVKLTAYEKIAITGSHLGFGFVLVILGINIFFLGVITLGLFIGELLNSYAAGFGLIMLIVIVLILFAVLFAKKLRRAIANLVISIIKKVERNEE